MSFTSEDQNDIFEQKKGNTDNLFDELKSPIQIKKLGYALSPFLYPPFIVNSKDKADVFTKSFTFIYPLMFNKKNSKILKLEPIDLSCDSYFPEEIEQMLWTSNSIEYVPNRKNKKSKELESANEKERNLKNNDFQDDLSLSNKLQNVDKSFHFLTEVGNNKATDLLNKNISDIELSKEIQDDKKKKFFINKKKGYVPIKDSLGKVEKSKSKNTSSLDNDHVLSYPKPLDLKKIKPLNELKYQKTKDVVFSSVSFETDNNHSSSNSNNNTNTNVYTKKDDDKSLIYSSNLPFPNTDIKNEESSTPSISLSKSVRTFEETDNLELLKAKDNDVVSNFQDIKNTFYEITNQKDKDKKTVTKLNDIENLVKDKIKNGDFKPLYMGTLNPSSPPVLTPSIVLDSFKPDDEFKQKKDGYGTVFESKDIF